MGIRFPEVEVIGGCELANIDTGNCKLILWKNSTHS